LDGNFLVPCQLVPSNVLAVPTPGLELSLLPIVTKDFSLLYQIKLLVLLLRSFVLLEISPVKLENGPLVPQLSLR
jgi:hypothetical protein